MNMNLITTIIGFGLSAFFVAFVCTRLICRRLRRLEAHHMLELEPRIGFDLPDHRINGLAAVAVSAIPTMKFNREAFSSTENTQCAICLSEYQEKEVLRMMPKCGHSFHLSCIDVWLRKQSTCPVCRLPVQGSASGQSFDGYEISTGHSRQWLLPHREDNLDSIVVEMEASSRSS